MAGKILTYGCSMKMMSRSVIRLICRSGRFLLVNITGAIEPVTRAVFNRSPASSFCQDLQGRVSGLNVINRSGMPGEGAFLHARGFTSLFSSSIPLVVVDGMIIRAEGFQDPVIHGFHQNPLVDLDKRDISSIVLLKDAVTSGIYGMKGSNGVLLINTIPPQGGKTTLDVSVSGGSRCITPANTCNGCISFQFLSHGATI